MMPVLLPPRPRVRRAAGPDAPPPGAPQGPEDAGGARQAPTATRPGFSKDELRLLIADDDPLFTEMLPRLLRRTIGKPALHISAARTADEALRLARAGPFDVILSDFDLRSEQTGVDVLRAAGTTEPVPFRILLSGHSPREIPAAPDAVDAFLGKPMTLREVVPSLTSLLHERLGILFEPPRSE